MKRKVIVLLIALLFGLTACGNTPGTDAPSTGNGDGKGDLPPASATADASYWTAVRYETYNPSYGRTEISKMPTEKWSADLYLNKDGTALFREVIGDCYSSCLFDATWWLGADSTLRVTGENYYGDIISMDGRKEPDGTVTLKTPYDNIFYFEPAECPPPGGEFCIADLEGIWRMTDVEAEGISHTAAEEHTASILSFERWWDGTAGDDCLLRAKRYYATGIDTSDPEYQTEKELSVERLDEPLASNPSNELWSARLFKEGSDTEYIAALTDRDTLCFTERSKKDGVKAASRIITYTRSDNFLPESLREVLSGEPDKTLIFYWRDPTPEVSEPLAAIPVTKLEQNGQNKLLLVGRWYATDIRFCTGKPKLNPDGTLCYWITDEVLYEGTIWVDQPQWFSLTVPEKTPNLCLFMKRPWDESWFTWPISDMEPFSISGNTFITEIDTD